MDFQILQNQQEINILKKRITNTEIERVIRRLPTTKNTSPDKFTVEFYKNFNELQPLLMFFLTKTKKKEPSETYFTRPVLFQCQNQEKSQ